MALAGNRTAGFNAGIRPGRVTGEDVRLQVAVIMNPVAGGGRLKRHWPWISTELNRVFGAFEMRETQQAGDAAALAFEFAALGFDLVIAGAATAPSAKRPTG